MKHRVKKQLGLTEAQKESLKSLLSDPVKLKEAEERSALLRSKADNADPISESIRPAKPTEPTGLGDRVKRIAQPIARAIDRVVGTNIQGCDACQKRQEYLNKKFPST